MLSSSRGRPARPPPPERRNLYPAPTLRRGVRLEERPFGGFARGALPVGCRQCTDGSKMVLFVTGICSFHCFYCPVSDEKMYKDVVFADEKRVTRDEDVLEEAHAIQATGAGITGGDPLDAVERTCHYIRLLKREFGPEFHTHLYTMSTDADKIRRLADAGLDEIRFHVPPGLWSRAAGSAFVGASRLARSLGLTVGLEVPLIPEREPDLIRLIEWAGAEGLAFVNLNEMEFSDANFPRMKVHGYEMKHELSYGVKGADPVALRILERLQGRLAAPVAHQATRGERRPSVGRHHGRRDPPQGNRRRRRSGAVDARPREDLSRPGGPHGRGRPEEAPRDRALDPRGDRAEAPAARVPCRGVSDLGRPRGRADSARVAAHLAQRNPSREGRHGPSAPPQVLHARPRNRRDHASSLDSVRVPSGNSRWRRAVGTKIAWIEHRDALALGSNRSTASVRRRSRSAMTARRRS